MTTKNKSLRRRLNLPTHYGVRRGPKSTLERTQVFAVDGARMAHHLCKMQSRVEGVGGAGESHSKRYSWGLKCMCSHVLIVFNEGEHFNGLLFSGAELVSHSGLGERGKKCLLEGGPEWAGFGAVAWLTIITGNLSTLNDN